MGVNVLLFFIFQIAVEPWRRNRLVKGFEEKVVEAIEKENSILAAKAMAQGEKGPDPVAEEDVNAAAVAAASESVQPDIQSEAPGAAELTEDVESPNTAASTELEPSIESVETQLPPPDTPLPSEIPLSASGWKQAVHSFFSDRRVTLSQRDLTTIAIESAAAGAAVMGLLIVAFRPR